MHDSDAERTSGLLDSVKITVLVDDTENPVKPELRAKHGLSFYLMAKTGDKCVKVMMDTGPTADIILHNADSMDVDLNKINLILLSHGHYDHIDGLLGVLKLIKDPIPIVVHPKIFEPKFAYRPYLKYVGASFRLNEIESEDGVFLRAENSVKIADGIISSGKIRRCTDFEKAEGFWKSDGELFIQDNMIDDQSLIANINGKGLVIVAGCAHSGIINTVIQAQHIMRTRRVHAIVGGFHLKNSNDKKIDATLKELEKINPDIIGPCHCTGSKATKRFIEVFNDRCKPLRVGEKIQL